jgi:hypothetical protein
MTDDGTEWHRRFATQAFNATWELIEKSDRSADDDLEMLATAATSRWHWGKVGDPEHIATSDWQVGHVACLLGMPNLALPFAERNLRAAAAHSWDGWRLASAHEGVARALATAGDVSGRDHHVALAREALAREPDDEDREIIAAQIDSIPDTVS